MITALVIAFAFSYLGSVPPGTLNLSVIQLTLDGRIKAAYRFTLACALFEMPYIFIGVSFQKYLLEMTSLMDYFELVAACVMFILAWVTLYPKNQNANSRFERIKASGFRKGVVLSLLNPLAIPFWIGVSTYVSKMGWINFNDLKVSLAFTFGAGLGTLGLLITLVYLGQKAMRITQVKWVSKLPGMIYIILGLYSLFSYFSGSVSNAPSALTISINLGPNGIA